MLVLSGRVVGTTLTFIDFKLRLKMHLLSFRRKNAALRDGGILLFVCLFVCGRKRVLVGYWPDWPSTVAVANILMVAGA